MAETSDLFRDASSVLVVGVQVDALTQFAEYMRRLQGVYLDTDPETGRRMGNY